MEIIRILAVKMDSDTIYSFLTEDRKTTNEDNIKFDCNIGGKEYYIEVDGNKYFGTVKDDKYIEPSLDIIKKLIRF